MVYIRIVIKRGMGGGGRNSWGLNKKLPITKDVRFKTSEGEKLKIHKSDK